MASIAAAIPFPYPVLPHSRSGRPWAFHEPEGRYHASRPVPRSDDAPARRRTPDVPAPRVRLHLKPGQKGTKQLLEQYGDRLVCVRYRYDPARRKRFKTVELIVAERPWQPPPSRLAPDRLVSLRIAFAEADLRRRVKQAGGRWNPDERTWQLPYDRAIALGLRRCIVSTLASNSRCPASPGGHPDADA